MAYIMRHSDKSGEVNVERVCDGVRANVSALVPARWKREHAAATKTHAEMLKENRARNGFKGKKKLFRHIATAPASAMREYRGRIPIQDTKALKRWISHNQFNTVGSRSY